MSAIPHQKFLGVDFGTKRTGLAIMDTESMLAMPLRSFVAESQNEVVAKILGAAEEIAADKIIIGLPKRLSGEGSPGENERRIGLLVERLRAEQCRPIVTEDERLTTAFVEAERRHAGIAAKNFDRDAAAAAAILDSYAARLVTDETSVN